MNTLKSEQRNWVTKMNKLKWSATFFVILGTVFNSLDMYPFGPMTMVVAGIMWFVVSVYWNDRALIVTNGTLTFVSVFGLIMHYFYGVI